MEHRLFPSDLEGSGCYRLLYPYGALEAFGGHDAYVVTASDEMQTPGGKSPMQIPIPTGNIPDGYGADAYVFQRRMEKYWIVPHEGTLRRTPFGVVDVVKWLQGHGKMVVAEVDDWLHDGLPTGAPAIVTLQKRKDLSFTVLRETVELADVLTVSTPALAEAYGHPNTVVLPNFLNWPDWADIEPVYEKDRELRVGWFGALNWRGRDLECLRGVIGPWLERNPGVKFVAVGGGDEAHDYLGIPADRRITVPYAKFPGHTATVPEIDIGLVPLRPGLFNECKSHLKGMEYAACGIPCIAYPTEPYRGWVDEGENGFLASKPAQWFRALDEMVADDRWRDMGRAARRKAEANTIQEHWPLWMQIHRSSTSAAPSTFSTPAMSVSSPAPVSLAA